MNIALAADMFNALPYFVLVIRSDETIVYSNKQAKNIFGPNLTNRKVKEALGVKESFDLMNTKPYGVNELIFSTMYKDKSFKVYDIDVEWQLGVFCRMITGVDITELKISHEQLIMEVSTDSMTKAHSKKHGIEFLEAQIEKSKNTGEIFTVCYIDLDDLKHINDNYGHIEGDNYIKIVVDLIKKMKRSSDMIARMGGDEFLLIFPNCSYSIVDGLMDTIQNQLSKVKLKNFQYRISYGILEVSDTVSLDLQYIVNTVDNNMYYMKDEHKRQKTLKINH